MEDFFTTSNEEESEDVVILDIPCDQDVVSISSEEFVQYFHGIEQW